MYIPMIFFTIIIEKRKPTPEQLEKQYLQQKAIAEWEDRKHQIAMQFPEFLYR
ncbi:YrzI family small protein [Brevibacillus sp. SAFN-007a]|uniref:YrzI family small protein n=1 Tax=Brevibacillus sp. SAFN-007a TaxID=3436862 RepID=UPI003F815907